MYRVVEQMDREIDTVTRVTQSSIPLLSQLCLYAASGREHILIYACFISTSIHTSYIAP